MEDNPLNKHWESIKAENYSGSFKEVENWIKAESYGGTNRPVKNRSYIVKTFSENKIKYAIIFGFLLVLYFTGNIPITQNKTIGNIVSWTVDKDALDAITRIDDFKWLDKSNLIVSDTTVDNKQVLTYKMLLPPDIDKAKLSIIRNDLKELNDEYPYNISAIFEPVKRPAYAAALYSLFNIDVSAAPENVNEIYNDVTEQLKEAGLEDDVDIDMDEDNDVHGTVFIIPKKGMDSIRIKVHDDIVRDVNIDKSIKNVKKTLQDLNIKINSDSIIKKVIIRLDNQTLKNLSRESEILNNSVLDSVKISVFNERMKNVTEHVKNIQDSVLNNLQIILNNYLPDVENVLDSIYENMDFDELNNMKVEVYDDSVDLENLNDEIEKNVNDKLKNLELNIEINNDSIYNFHNIPGIPDSIKSKMYQYKHKIKNNKHREEEKEKEEKENEEDDNN